jgi:hypothetical protein
LDQKAWHAHLIAHLRKNGAPSMSKLELERFTDNEILEKTAKCVFKTMKGNWLSRDQPTDAVQQKNRSNTRLDRVSLMHVQLNGFLIQLTERCMTRCDC